MGSPYVQAENKGLKQQLQAEQTRVDDMQAEMQRRCTSFECQLQSACSECTAAAEEHVTGSLKGMEKRLDRLQVQPPPWNRAPFVLASWRRLNLQCLTLVPNLSRG